jgi:preprotein translocase subunit SecE
MAVADVEKVSKIEKPDKNERTSQPGEAGAVKDAVGWLPRKFGEGKAFLAEVRSELKKSTWPSRGEVYSTTLVVIATSIFFGFYLWGLDLVFSRVLSLVFKRQF